MVVVVVEVVLERRGTSNRGDPNLSTIWLRVVTPFSIHVTSSRLINSPYSSAAHPLKTRLMSAQQNNIVRMAFTPLVVWDRADHIDKSCLQRTPGRLLLDSVGNPGSQASLA